jgi:hypothetical protein
MATMSRSYQDEIRTRPSAWVLIWTAIVIASIAACTPRSDQPSSPPLPSGVVASASPSGDIQIPISQLNPEQQCYVAHGFKLVKIMPSGVEGEPPGDKFVADLTPEEFDAVTKLCAVYHTEAPPPTEAQIRATYDRWVRERDCLVGLGYQPTEPPTVERFLVTWGTGPWAPIDGIDTNAWTDSEYQRVKQSCGLEMFNRD